jgi:hypothetical protein
MAVKTAFGLDIAGYAGSNSGFARADLNGDGIVQVTVYQGHVFGNKLRESGCSLPITAPRMGPVSLPARDQRKENHRPGFSKPSRWR